ncbi:nuclear transport factor 2 family protein [Lysobacter niastensis]|uniref:Nuclear transport factor 2 family protein n=1 Tax=Lysobacter niastensis TaxID=380629 RepID=A0ABS0B3E0_9GAMM|nr:nuclear transport factor 2 family protein [Lysobacter niastensis]MBF6022989.1 nuclear transport factor 2 family protein [Lysobacter niastensis]
MNTEAVAKRLVELCRTGQYEQAQRELYADDAVSIEPVWAPPGAIGNAEGLPAIYEKGRKFAEGIEEFHGASCGDPVIAADWFSVAMGMDATFKGMGRVNMQEICVYRVRDGKIVHEQFFYSAD